MTLETKFENLKNEIDSQFSPNEAYLVLANYLLTVLATMSNTADSEDVNNHKYDYDDLLNYNYVLEYLKYNPREEALVLAHAIHSLLFLYNSGKKV